MITFAEIAATAPSDVTGMTKHLMNATLGQETVLADYYSKGGDAQSQWYDLAKEFLVGEIDYGATIDALMSEWRKTWDRGDDDEYFAAREAFSDRFDRMVDRVGSGLGKSPLAVIRPDTEAGVMIGLGVRPGMLLTEEEINNLLSGRRVDGEKIEGKHYAVERALPVDKRNGVRKWSTPIGSFDFCSTPHKSVSIVWAFGSEIERAKIFNAHLEANREAVGYIRDEIAIARLGKGGQAGREDGAVCILEFSHHTSRRVQIVIGEGRSADVKDAGFSGDMNIHTHNLMVNAVFCPSGRVGSLDTNGVRGLLKEAGAFYQARLGTKLREAGFDAVLDERTGSVCLPVVPVMANDLFSKKTVAGERAARKEAADAGLEWDTLSENERVTRVKEATQRFELKKDQADGSPSRGAKDDVANFKDWRRQANEAGWDIPESFQLIGPPLRELTREERHRVAYDIALPWLAKRFEHEAVLQHFDLRRAALRGLVHTGMESLDDVDAVTKIMREEGVLMYGEKTPLQWGMEEGKRYVSVTTSLADKSEAEFMRLALKASQDKSGAIPAGLLMEKIEQSGLDFTDTHGKSQREAIERVGSGGRFSLVVAAAGAGKTTSLVPLVASWKEMGRDVYGASLAWRQADDLVEAGIDKRNVKAFSVLLKGLDEDTIKLTDRSVVCIDEFGLLGTRQGLELLRYQDRIGFSVIALGDEKQCQAIEAGAIIDLARRALGTERVPEILTTRRQEVDREKMIVGLLRKGRAAEALAMKREDGTAEMAYGGRAGVVHRVAKLYAERLAATGEAPTVSAPTNSDAHQISAAVRLERRKLGQIGDNDLRVVLATDGTRDYSMPLAAGDKVRLFKSTGAAYAKGNGGSIGRNGSVLEVVKVSDKGLVLKTKDGKVGTVAWDSLRAERGARVMLAYGDCMTIHTAQGSTAKEHIFALPSGSKAVTGYTAYSAATRHKKTAYLITNDTAELIAVRESRPINDTHEITMDDKWAQVAKRLAYQPERDTATAMMERIANIKRGAVRAFHDIKQVADPRLRPVKREAAPESVQWRRMDAVMKAAREVAGRAYRHVMRA